MVRGIERTTIFRDDTDRAEFLARLASGVERGAATVYAWALLPNHAHLLLRTGTRPLAQSMRSLLTGHAGAFNRRHKRVGHLFQNAIAYLWVSRLGQSGRRLAPVLGIAPQSVYRAAARGAGKAVEWTPILTR